MQKGLLHTGSVLALSVKACRLCQLPQSGSPWQSTQTPSLCQGLSLGGKTSPAPGEDVAQRQKGECVTAGDGEGEPAKEKASATTIRRLSEIQKRLLQMLLLYTILRHAKGTSARNIILRPSGHPDARAVCVPERRTAAAMQSTGCRQKHRQKRHRPSIHGKTR